MDTAETIVERLESCFSEIAGKRMAGIPILNNRLSVRAIGMDAWQDHWLCVLVTPWFMNVVLIPRVPDDAPIAVGAKQIFAFPAGSFEFIQSHEPSIGFYWMCSLFSPVFEFADQESAEATAAAALDALLAGTDSDETDGQDMAMIWRGELPDPHPEPDDAGPRTPSAVSRRALLTGRLAEEDRP